MSPPGIGEPAALAEPRFDLRFHSGRGHLVMRRPVLTFPARIETLVLAVDLPKRFDLGRGIEKLRRMRARVEEVSMEVRWRNVVRAASTVGVDLSLRGLRGARLALATRDEAGVLAAELDVLGDGVDVVFGLRRMAWVRETPRPALERLIQRLAPLGVRWDSDDGVFRLRRPLRSVLAELLLPAGHRLPEERPLGVRVDLRRRGVWLRTDDKAVPADLDRYRRQLATPPAWLAAALDGGPCPIDDDPAELRSPWLRGDAVRARIEAALDDGGGPLPEADGDALLDALWLHPVDLALWRQWVVRLTDHGDPVVLRLVRALLDMAGRDHEPLVVEALSLAARAGVPGTELAPLLAAAERAAPGSPYVWALRAEAASDPAEAAELWTRAAGELPDDPALAARWLRSAAVALRGLRGPEAALPLARRAAAAAPSDVHAAVLLTELLSDAHSLEALESAYGRLLDVEPDDDSAEEVWERGLARAAAFHVQQGHEDRARPFLAALEGRIALPGASTSAPGSDEAPAFELDGPSPESGEIALDGPLDSGSGEFDGGDEDPEDEADDDWPKSEIWEAPPKDLAESDEVSFDDEWSPSEVWDAEPRRVDQGDGEAAGIALASESPASGTHSAPPAAPGTDSPPPLVTQVGVADDELRELLEDVQSSSDPSGLLEGALEGALDNEDEGAVRRVLMVLDRLGTFTENDELRTRALRWLTSLE